MHPLGSVHRREWRLRHSGGRRTDESTLNAKCGEPHIIIGNRAKALLYVPSARAVKRYKQSGHLLKNYRRGSFPRRQFLDLFSELFEFFRHVGFARFVDLGRAGRLGRFIVPVLVVEHFKRFVELFDLGENSLAPAVDEL